MKTTFFWKTMTVYIYLGAFVFHFLKILFLEFKKKKLALWSLDWVEEMAQWLKVVGF